MITPVSSRVVLLNAVGLILAAALFHFSRGTQADQFTAFILLLCTCGLMMAWVWRDPHFTRVTYAQVALTLAVQSAAMFAAQPLLEDDHHRYLWDGFIAATTGHPYAFAPQHFFGQTNVTESMQVALNNINHPELPTVYGPVWQTLFAIGYWVAPGALWPIKAALLIGTLGLLALLRSTGVNPRWALIFVLHPLVVKESMISAHPDLLIGASLLWASLLWQRGKHTPAALVVCLAIGMKLSALIALPFFLFTREGKISLRACGAVSLGLVLVLSPQLAAFFAADTQGLAALGRQWVFNPLLFRPLSALMGDSAARVFIWIGFCIAWCVIAVRWYATKGDAPPIVPVFIALLLLSPVVNAWYWLWILPLALPRFSLITWVGASVGLCAYAHMLSALSQGHAASNFVVPIWSTTLQLVSLFAALALMVKQRQRGVPNSAPNFHALN
jgi:alpha-1,6-mannosyltransferase